MNDIWQPQFSILSMFLITYAKYHLTNPIFISAKEGGLLLEANIYRPPPMQNWPPSPEGLVPPKRFEDFGA